jgi:hypothetical protein
MTIFRKVAKSQPKMKIRPKFQLFRNQHKKLTQDQYSTYLGADSPPTICDSLKNELLNCLFVIY